MRTTMKNILVIGMMLMLPMLGYAVDYKNQYNVRSTKYNVQSTMSQSMATAPAVGFQSTSIYSLQLSTDEPTLNSDGSVNEAAYMGGRNNVSGPRKVIDNPDEDDDTNWNGSPIGDALLPLLLLACAYIILIARKRKGTVQ